MVNLLYAMSHLSVSTLSELQFLKKPNGSPATGEIETAVCNPLRERRGTAISLLHWNSNIEIADFIVYQIIQTHKVRYG
jgi:hypothetical protein